MLAFIRQTLGGFIRRTPGDEHGKIPPAKQRNHVALDKTKRAQIIKS